MHRSSSSSRVSDEFFSHSPSSSSPDTDHLPTYNPQSHVAKKERTRLRSAETAIHFIPLLLLLSAIILWFFSNPAVELVNKGDSIVARVEGLTNNGDGGSNGAKSSLPSNSEQEDFDPTTGSVDHKQATLMEDES